MRSEGASLAQVALAAGLTRQGVKLICDRSPGDHGVASYSPEDAVPTP
jgi:hypothetical protein